VALRPRWGLVCSSMYRVLIQPMKLLDWLQFAAIIAALVYFGWKLVQGWLLVNMSLSGTTERRARGDGQDDLVVAVTLTRGQTGSAAVHETAVRVSWSDDPRAPRTTHLKGTTRLETAKEQLFSLAPGWERADKPYKLPPGEATTWSCHVEVPTGQVCDIEIVVLGVQWPNRRAGQWRASLVSLPV
jgi:hypothetical protein